MRARFLAFLALIAAGCTGATAPPDTDKGDGPDESDTEAPAISITSPADGDEVSGEVALEATASDNLGVSSVEFFVERASVGVLDTIPYDLTWDSTTVADGDYEVEARATDAAGNVTEATLTLSVDNVDGEPGVRIVNPEDGQTVCGTVVVEAAADAEVGVLVFLLDGKAVDEDSRYPNTFYWNSDRGEDGAHRLGAHAVFTDGSVARANIGVNAVNDGIECDELPIVKIEEPNAGSYNEGTVKLLATVTDDVEVDKVEFLVDGDSLDTDGSDPFDTKWATDDVDEGRYTLEAIATDSAGQSATTESYVYVDRSAPTVEITSPLSREVDGTVAMSADVTDAVSVKKVWLEIDGDRVAEFTEPPYEYVWDSTTADYGNHDFEWGASDHAGHKGYDRGDVDVDNAPSVTITSPADGEVVYGEVSVEIDAQDDDEVDEVVYFLDGVEERTDTSTPWTWTLDTCDLAAGDHTLKVEAYDFNDAKGSDEVDVTVDQPLEISLDGPSGTVAPSETLSAYVSDDDTVTDVTWDLDGTVVATVTAGTAAGKACPFACEDLCQGYTATLDVTAVAEGAHTLTATATDASGNVATASTTITVAYDRDGDGHQDTAFGGDDCDDEDATVSPDGTETCNEVDDDCDGTADEGYDLDGDGFTDASQCSAGEDCDDADAAVNPDATEDCDGIDNDCDGYTDVSGPPGTDVGSFADNTSSRSITNDIYGNVYSLSEDATLASFEVYIDPSGTIDTWFAVYEATSLNGTYTLVTSTSGTESGSAGFSSSGDLDIELTAGNYYLLAFGTPDTATFYYDTSPSLTEDAGLTPEGYVGYTISYSPATIDSNPSTGDLYYERVNLSSVADEDVDDDGDGETEFCGDCDDADDTVNTSSAEVCDGADNDCDGVAESDEVDDDGDGEMVCAGDCDDADPSRYSANVEACDGIDNDCDGDASNEVDGDGDGLLACEDCDDNDASITILTTHPDADGDGYGDPTISSNECGTGSGYVLDDTDCDDTDAAVNPGATEVCNSIDDDCDGTSDEGYDADGDGAGDCDDCDDTDPDVNLGMTEVCGDAVDEDCDGRAPLCQFADAQTLEDADVILTGADAGDQAGYSVAGGDLDADGFGDMVVGANAEASSAGAVYLVRGSLGSDLDLGSSSVLEFTGEDAGDEAGAALAVLGDGDGDGDLELAVGATGESTAGASAGAVYLLPGGATAGGSLSAADAKIVGEDGSDKFGGSVAAAGDLDGDGYADLLVGALGDDAGGSDSGAAYVQYGPVAGSLDASALSVKIIGESSYDYAGTAVAGAGDIDGDGSPDLVIGAPGDDDAGANAGAAYILLAGLASTEDLATADYKLTGAAARDAAGDAVAGVGDTDGDGYADVLVGAYGNDDAGSTAGAAYLVLGPIGGDVGLASADAIFTGEAADDNAGSAVAETGDVDGDGLADLLIGAYGNDDGGSGAGAAYLFYGAISGTASLGTADLVVTGTTASDALGWALGTAGDVDGDGFPDLLLGAYGYDGGGSEAGGAMLYFADP